MALELDKFARSPEQRLLARVAELERRIRDLERASTVMPVIAGAPSSTDGKSGSMSGDSTNIRLWLKIGSTWRYTPLT